MGEGTSVLAIREWTEDVVFCKCCQARVVHSWRTPDGVPPPRFRICQHYRICSMCYDAHYDYCIVLEGCPVRQISFPWNCTCPKPASDGTRYDPARCRCTKEGTSIN